MAVAEPVRHLRVKNGLVLVAKVLAALIQLYNAAVPLCSRQRVFLVS